MQNRHYRKIISADIQHYHPKMIGSCPTDRYYADAANEILDLLKDKEEFLPRKCDIRDLAVRLTMYLEDVISEGPTWRAFLYLCRKLYNRDLPFFPDIFLPESSTEYVEGEVNLDDVNFIIWSFFQQTNETETLLNPHNPAIQLLSIDIFALLYDLFEELPINQMLNVVIDIVPGEPYARFLHYRSVMEWILTRNYLLSPIDIEDILEEERLENKGYFGKNIKNELIKYAVTVVSVFDMVCGPLSLYPKQWLAAMMKSTSGHESTADMILDIKSRNFDIFLIKGADKEHVYLQDYTDEIYKVATESVAAKKNIKDSEGVVTSIVKFYPNEWYINGLAEFCTEAPSLRKIKEAKQIDEYGFVIEENGQKPVTKEEYYKSFGKKRHKFFASKRTLLEAISPKKGDKNNPQYQQLLNESDDTQPIFVYILDDGHLYISEFLAEVLPSRDNPYRIKTKESATELFAAVLGDSVDPEVIQYIIDKGWAKTLSMNSIRSKAEGKRLLQENLSFLNRFLHPSSFFARHTDI